MLVQMCSKYRKQPSIAVSNGLNELSDKEVTGIGNKGQGTRLPKGLQANMESAFGQDFSEITIKENSAEAINMGAEAFAYGESIYFAPGAYNPHTLEGKETIGHEFAHVVQQRKGNIQPTGKTSDGKAVNDEPKWENQADSLGKKAIRGENVDNVNGWLLSGKRESSTKTSKRSGVVQMLRSRYGEFKTQAFTTLKNPLNEEVGVEIYLKFVPGNKVNARSIGMVQAVRSVVDGEVVKGNKQKEKRSISAKDARANFPPSPVQSSDEGTHIDQLTREGYRNPVYATEEVSVNDTELSEGKTPLKITKRKASEKHLYDDPNLNYSGLGVNGYRYKKSGSWTKKNAELHDAPGVKFKYKNSEQLFETTALALSGKQEGIYYGSVQWGWRTDSNGNFSKIPLAKLSEGTPTSSFIKAAQIWNANSDSAGNKNIALPAQDVLFVGKHPGVEVGKGSSKKMIPFGTRVIITDWDIGQSKIRVVDGALTGTTGFVSNTDMVEERG